jgi:hypothetical protein
MVEEIDVIASERRVTARVSSQHTCEVQFREQMLWRVYETVGSLLFFDR